VPAGKPWLKRARPDSNSCDRVAQGSIVRSDQVVRRHVACYSVPVRKGAFSKERIMNKDQVKGTVEKMKGKVNEAMGKATNNPARELKGDLQQAGGQARKDAGDVKEAAKDIAKKSR
jgi:uncharacterized protein YjbJ (UPF0337 family)